MSQLDDIKARAQTNSILGKTASQDEAKDTLKLVAALEAVEALCAQTDTDTNGYFRVKAHWIHPDTIRQAIAEALA